MYADVAVDAPVGHDRTFTYSIPDRVNVQPGQLVWVPFGTQTLQGIVVELSSVKPEFATRPILQAVDPAPLISPEGLELGRWISGYYRAPLFASLSLMLPPGFESHVRSRIMPGSSITPEAETGRVELREETAAALQSLDEKGHMLQADFLKLLGKRGVRELNGLAERGIVHREVTIPHPEVAPKYEGYLTAPAPASYGEAPGETPEGLTSRQKALLESLRQPPGNLPLAEANREFGSASVKALWEKGMVAQEWWRTSGGPRPIPPAEPQRLTLTAEQRHALTQITSALDVSFGLRSRTMPGANTPPPLFARSFLLHGVTGSGKTEVYLRAMAHAVGIGRRAVFLVPEIALTHQTIERVNAWFPGRVALLHSRQTTRQKFDQWWDIRGGGFDVAVGPRSALFAPMENLGLIVIDEEHEWTYKQEDTPPLYHARATALELARRTGAVVVLGSATPSVESYYHASRGRISLLSLPHRVAGAGNASRGSSPARLAEVQVCDMRRELRQGNRHIFSGSLSSAMRQCFDAGNQAILFLNRRGASSIVQCRDCGYVAACRRCSTPLTYHAGPSRLLCHQCNYSRRPLPACPECRGARIRQLGLGTESVVSEVSKLFPGIRVDRLDSDAARSAGAAEEAVARLASGETQALVGTQMIAKGLDVPNVALVGVVLADIGLHVPDFRAGERVFSLLCQVAGRAGRGDAPGRVFIQTYAPDHYAIRAGANQDYLEMYRQEIEFRRSLGYPPFSQLAHIVYQNSDADAAQRQAAVIVDELRRRVVAEGRSDIEVTGPAPGLPPRLRGRHRWHLLLRGRNLASFLDGTDFPAGCVIDIDPAHVT